MYAGGKSFFGGPQCLMSCCGTLPLMPAQGETCVERRPGRGASQALGFCQPSLREGQCGLVVLGYTPFPPTDMTVSPCRLLGFPPLWLT